MRAIADHVATVFSSTRLHRHVHIAGRHRVALREELEVVNDRLHGCLQLFARGRQDLAVVDVDGPIGQPVQCLAEDLHRLAHLLDAYEVAAVAVAKVRGRDLEVVVLVARIRDGGAEVPGHA